MTNSQPEKEEIAQAKWVLERNGYFVFLTDDKNPYINIVATGKDNVMFISVVKAKTQKIDLNSIIESYTPELKMLSTLPRPKGVLFMLWVFYKTGKWERCMINDGEISIVVESL